MVKVEETIKINIPVGVENGNYMTLDCRDMKILIELLGSYVFWRGRYEYFQYTEMIYYCGKNNFSQAVFGDKINVPLLMERQV